MFRHPTSGYHETITAFWLRIVDATVQQYGQLPTADEFLVDFYPQLSQKKNHRLFYSPALSCTEAKREFVEPDLTDLPTPTNSTTIAQAM